MKIIGLTDTDVKKDIVKDGLYSFWVVEEATKTTRRYTVKVSILWRTGGPQSEEGGRRIPVSFACR